jgi:hypothetical protein
VRGDSVSALARLEQPRDLVDLLDDGVCEPLSADPVVQPAQRSAAEVHLLDVMDADTSVDLVDLEPGVQMLRDTVLERDVDAVRRLPPVAGDHRARELSEEPAVLAGDHPVGSLAQLRDPHDLGVGLRVLGGVEDEVERFLRRDPSRDRGAFTSDHYRRR